MKRKILVAAYRAGYEIMRRAQIKISIMDLEDMKAIDVGEVSEELERMDNMLDVDPRTLRPDLRWN